MEAERQRLQERLGYSFADPQLLALALRHESSANESEEFQLSNERLEFLGDSVLGLVVCDFLYRYYPDLPEGRLAQMKATLVSTEHLADKARDLELGVCVELGRGEQEGSRDRSNLLADTLEALFGAIHLEGGYEQAQRIILELLADELQNAQELRRDFKSLLQEVTQRDFQCLPDYQVTDEIGPPHDRVFGVTVVVQGESLGKGTGRSKREASQRAAQEALQRLDASPREDA
jgi:ribonuclease III